MRRRRYLEVVGLAASSAAVAGCSGDDGTATGPDRNDDGMATATERNDVYRAAFRDAVERDGHAVEALAVETRVALAYSPAEPTEDGVRESLTDVARRFFDRVDGGWDVEGLDARVYVDGGLVVTWRMERAWIEAYLAGDITREELGRRVEGSVQRHDRTPSRTEASGG